MAFGSFYGSAKYYQEVINDTPGYVNVWWQSGDRPDQYRQLAPRQGTGLQSFFSKSWLNICVQHYAMRQNVPPELKTICTETGEGVNANKIHTYKVSELIGPQDYRYGYSAPSAMQPWPAMGYAGPSAMQLSDPMGRPGWPAPGYAGPSAMRPSDPMSLQGWPAPGYAGQSAMRPSDPMSLQGWPAPGYAGQSAMRPSDPMSQPLWGEPGDAGQSAMRPSDPMSRPGYSGLAALEPTAAASATAVFLLTLCGLRTFGRSQAVRVPSREPLMNV
eukprot:gnl/TRDRNA2_/TRDRNA2_153057_c0_seq3.p1 gnl/TRDRNA2_/TRDRNA2_153057_c0~~gnl/TRDRNA2_/TRDRNA2_153057_c0_seq3.p1  ORF type:complete len:273 (+),score=13.98 gnl/TRDRNA2_/TRDRNA2_153057_c0_seq3:112-930(+)